MHHAQRGRKRRLEVRPESPMVMLGTTIVIALGVIGVAVLSARLSGTPVRTTGADLVAPGGRSVQEEAPTSSLTLILMNDDAAVLLRPDGGKEERIPRAELERRFGQRPRPAEGVDVANGSMVVYPDPKAPAGALRSPDGAHLAHLADPRADGATAIVLTTDGEDRTVVLRQGNEPLRDGALAGWFDARTLAIVAYSEATKAVFAARLDGTLIKLVDLPDDVVASTVRNGAFWYMTAVQGPGIETLPMGPSRLRRVSVDGKDVAMADEPTSVITGLMTDATGRIVYMTDDGRAVTAGLGVQGGRIDLGRKRPIALLPDGRVVLRDGHVVYVHVPENGEVRALGEVPEGAVKAFVTPYPLEATGP